jgi:basic amino acid/polyamine antiporter, APA family
VRSIARWDLVAVVLNGVIGAGIFGLPSKVFALAGSASVLAFLACAGCVVLVVLAFAEVGSRFSGSGGPYLYALEAYGPVVGFTVGWLVWLARVTSFSANCSLLPKYIDLLFPGAASGLARVCIVTITVAALAVVNIRGVRVAANASNVLAIGKLVPLAIFVLAGLFFVVPARLTSAPAPGYHGFSQAVMLLVYAFTGFEMAVIPAGEARNPRRDLPAALLTGMAAVVTFYVLIQVVCIGTLPGLAASERPLGDAVKRFLGTGGAIMITLGILISLAGNLNVLILAASRVIYAMAERGALPDVLAEIDPRYRTPVISVLATTGVMLALTLSGTFIYLVTLSTVVRLVTYLITCGALPVLRRRADAPPALFRMPAGVPVAALAMALCCWLLTNVSPGEMRDSAIQVAAGLAIYGVHRWRKRKHAHSYSR